MAVSAKPPGRRLLETAVIGLLLALGASALTQCDPGTLSLTGKLCPCVEGYVCDAASNTCVPSSSSIVSELDATVGNGSDGASASDGRSGSADACTGPSCPCASDADCRDPALPHCGPNALCVECLPSADDCPTLQYCTSSNRCAAGCKSNVECAGASADAGGALKLCDPKRHDCVECIVSGDCAGGMVCSPSGACVTGCDLEGGAGCPPGKACCDRLCLDTTSDPLNCNGCGIACGGASPACCAGKCVDKYASAGNCGACGAVCSTSNGTPSCSLGVCGWSCSSGYAHCASGNTGCETNTTNDPNHCGDCATACANTVKNASGAACAQSACTYTSCAPGYTDCNGNRADGCESALGTATSCASCSDNCTTRVLNATGIACAGNKTCTYSACQPGFGNCNGNLADGCETSLSQPTSCGACSVNCTTLPLHATGIGCNGSSCTYTACSPGFNDCNGNPGDGCECACGGYLQPCCPGNVCAAHYICKPNASGAGTCSG